MGALLFRLSWWESVLTISQLALILVSFLLTGLLLMRTQSAQNIKMRFGGVAGEGPTLGLLAIAATMSASFPVVVIFIVRGSSLVLQAAASFGIPVTLGLLYLWLLQRQKWTLQH